MLVYGQDLSLKGFRSSTESLETRSKNQNNGVPILEIVTLNGAPILDKVNYVTATYTLRDGVGGPIIWRQPGRIRGRGNSTWTMPKKPWKVKLDVAAPFMDVAPSKDWALLANYIDPSRIRNQVVNQMASHTGLPWAPHTTNVEVYLNTEYQGLYSFTESVEVDPARVNVTKIKTTDIAGTALTGGYVMEVDTRLEENAEVGWRTRLNVPIIFDTPDGLVTQQYNYMKDYTQQAEDALYAEDFASTGLWKTFFDVDSWVDWYLLTELSCNNDAGFGASVKITKPRGGNLHLGPPWDYDASFGITFWVDHPLDQWWVRQGATWIARMLEDPSFVVKMKERWVTFRDKLLTPGSTIYDWIRVREDLVAPALARDLAKWGEPDEPRISTYLYQRLTWMDNELTNGYTDTTPPPPPTNFRTTATTPTSVSFAWDESVGAIGYRIRQNGRIVAQVAFPYSTPMNSVTAQVDPTGTFTIQSRDATGNWSAEQGL